MRRGRDLSHKIAAEILERRYRRLLALYPPDYRAVYAEEMLGVALARSSPGRRRPELGEAVSLIMSGIGKRLGGARTGYRDPAWRDAAAVIGLIGPVLLAAFSARDVIGAMSGWVMLLSTVSPSWRAVASAAGWTMVAVAAACGWHWGRRWRAVAAVGACLGTAGQTAVLVRSSSPAGLVSSWWKLVFAVVIALSALVAIKGESRPFSWRPIMAIVTAGAAIAAYPAVERATVTVTLDRGGGGLVSSPLFGIDGYVSYGLFTVLGITMLVAIARCRPQVRRRVVILLLPVGVTIPVIAWTFGGFLASSARFVNPIPLIGPQWAALALIPLAGFAAGLFWLHRYERMLSSLSAK